MWCPPFKSGQVTLVSPHVPVSWIHLVIAIPKIPSPRYLVGPRALETYFLSCVRAPPPAAVLPDAVKFIQSAIQCWVSLKSQPCRDSGYSESECTMPGPQETNVLSCARAPPHASSPECAIHAGFSESAEHWVSGRPTCCLVYLDSVHSFSAPCVSRNSGMHDMACPRRIRGLSFLNVLVGSYERMAGSAPFLDARPL